MRRSRYSDYEAPDPAVDPTQALIDAPEPAEAIRVEPLLTIGGLHFTPTSRCPHWCKRCSGSGVVGIAAETGGAIECPDCLDPETGKGTGDSWPDEPFVCLVCHRGWMDGRKTSPPGDSPAIASVA